jgi:hypothetical protein
MQIAATIAVVASVLVLVLQTRAVAKEASIANQVAGGSSSRAPTCRATDGTAQ